MAICDPSEEYAGQLAQFLNCSREFPLSAAPFTDTKHLLDYMKEQALDMLLIAESLMDDSVRDSGIRRILILSEDPESSEEEKELSVYRYQSCSSLMNQLMQYCEVQVPASASELSAGAEVIGVYSPLGRCGKTSLALALGEILAESGRVLYLNMESCSGMGELSNETWNTDISDLVYHMRIDNARIREKTESAVCHWGKLDYIPPVLAGCDIHDITYEEWSQLLLQMISGLDYDVLILDIGEQTEELIRILELCGRIYMPVLDDRISRAKLHQFDILLSALGKDSLREKMVRVHVPKIRNDLEVTDFPEQLVRGKVGSFVRHMLGEERK